ncbi:MAG: HAD-IC family P-type ATPase [Deltaproteobacteria bacterium]|nr:HAD-IC family P-type ATPase [Deltaproteobacteria bacterium]
MNWYQRNTEAVIRETGTRPEGLTAGEAAERLVKYGPNRLPEEEGVSRMKIFFHQFKSPLIYILLAAAVVTAILAEYIDTGVIVAVLIINAVVGYFQEYKAETSVRALRNMIVPKARVVREGKETEIPSEDLVPGDIVLLASGAKVPADLRLLEVTELKVEEAALTGESIPVEKTVAPVGEENLTAGDQTNMAFTGTIVLTGRARGVVVETGLKTILGGIARAVKGLAVSETPLQLKIAKFAQFIGLLVLGSAAAIIALGFILGMAVADIFTIAVAAAVAAVPEGLPIVVTVTMAIGISRMARRNAVMRKISSVETLGSTTIICSDKTGTLTKNEMTVKALFDGKQAYEVTGAGYDGEGEILHDWEAADEASLWDICRLLRIGLLCNESQMVEADGHLSVDGDPTEGALIVSAMKAGLNMTEEQKNHPRVGMIPFESERGFMATLHRQDEKLMVFVKGAPEKVLEMCDRSADSSSLDKERIIKTSERFAADGLRVLAMAYRELPGGKAPTPFTHETLGHDLVFAGLQGMIDPPRPEAVEAIAGCKAAGIRVAMITGDHAVTAAAIGKTMGIGDGKATVLTGRQVEEMDDAALYNRVQETSVYARVSPQHKLRIVQQYMRHGEIVAVTGDGVNDAPALKAAHIGAAMGKGGTDVAREAADMVLTDDNFASIFHAVEEGRIVFDNIRKVTLFLIPTGLAAILSILIAMALDIPVPYVAAQLLWINLVTNGLQDVALAFEPGEADIIRRKPRKTGEGIMSRLMYERSLLVGIIISVGVIFTFYCAIEEGASVEHARTVAMTTMVLFQFFQAWNCRSETRSVFAMNPLGNAFLFFSMIAAFIAQIAVVYWAPLQWIFRTDTLSAMEWAKIACVALTVVVAVEIDKFIRRRRNSPA